MHRLPSPPSLTQPFGPSWEIWGIDGLSTLGIGIAIRLGVTLAATAAVYLGNGLATIGGWVIALASTATDEASRPVTTTIDTVIGHSASAGRGICSRFMCRIGFSK